MTFKELVENMKYETAVQMSDATDAMDAYERHIMNGVQEAVAYRAHDFVGGVLAVKWKDLFLTLHHLVEDDPDADNEADAVFGTVLAMANEDVGLGISSFLREHTDELTSIISRAVDKTIDKYKTYPFSPPGDFFRRFHGYLPAATPELGRLESLAYTKGQEESSDPNRIAVRTEHLEMTADGEETLENARIGIRIDTALEDDEARESFLVAAVALIDASEQEMYSDTDGEAVFAGILAEYFAETPEDPAGVLTEELDEPLTQLLRKISAGDDVYVPTVYGDAEIWEYTLTADQGRIWLTATVGEDEEESDD